MPVARCLIPLLLAAALGALADAAHAHGGRFQGPGGRGPPGDPTVPGPGTPSRNPPVTTPGAGIPSTRGALPDIHWGTWWALNRWAYLPERGAALRRRRALTGSSDAPTSQALTTRRRLLLGRQVIKPYLLRMLAPEAKQRDTVRAAALLALAKIDTEDATVELVLRVAEDARATPLERESAVLAAGLLRRTDPDLRVDAITLDLVRLRLGTLAAEPKTPIRARCFACFALGLLADQGYASPFARDGRLVVRRLLEILRAPGDGPDLAVAAMTSLAMQPAAGIPTDLHEALQRIVAGAPVHKRAWTPLARAHALTTYARLRAPGWVALALRALADRRLPKPVQRAARLALGGNATALEPTERVEVVGALLAAAKGAPDHVTEGLGQIALARILAADLRGGRLGVFELTRVRERLLQGAAKSLVPVRGFHVLALALALRDVDVFDRKVLAFRDAARATLLAGFDKPRGGGPDLQGAYAVGLGLLGVREARDRLVAVLGEPNSGPTLRARAAIALAQLGAVGPEVQAALRGVIADTHPLAPRSAAALALSLLTGVPESETLVAQLQGATTQREQVRAAAALGQLDDPTALPAVLSVARRHEHNFELRALAIAILGLLGDPEATPSLFRLTLDANYIARTDALQEAFTLL